MGHVYVLQCAQRKVYVGYTDNLDNRLQEHWKGLGCAWTRTYPPVRVLKVYKSSDKFDEVKITCREMWKYGIQNVRGGPFVQMELPDNVGDLLLQFSRHFGDACFICGKRGHYSKECWSKYYTMHNNEYLPFQPQFPYHDDDNDDEAKGVYPVFKQRNQRYLGHSPSTSSRLICYFCKKTGHKSTECFQAPTCYRCGMRGHFASNCNRT